MYKYAGRQLDQQDAEGNLEKFADLSDNAFALPAARRFPINSPEETVKSTNMFIKNASILGEEERDIISRNLEKAASWYHLQISLPVFEKVANTRKQTVQEAMAQFETEHHKIDWERRREIACELCKEAGGKDLPPAVMTYSSEIPNHDMAQNIMLRRGYTADENDQKVITQLMHHAAKEDPNIIIRALAKIDDILGLTPLYGKGIPDPVISVVGGDKLKQEAPLSIMIGGQSVKLPDLKDIDFDNLLETDRATKLRTDPSLISKQPPEIQAMILKEISTRDDA